MLLHYTALPRPSAFRQPPHPDFSVIARSEATWQSPTYSPEIPRHRHPVPPDRPEAGPYKVYFYRVDLLLVRNILHGQANAFAFLIHFQHAYLNHIVRFKNNLQDEHPGITLVRSQRDAGFTPYTSGLPQVLTFNAALPIATQVKMKIVARHNYTALYIDGVKVGEFNKQSILPLMRLGGDKGNSFKGILQDITIYNYEK